ncbi:MAG TPA: C-GCAxxG-C-C family (seleno)protein [Ignavibacteriales bacterium]|nr:C-GCAxxG-C-C family (seleno)protein [Ignavibacteriales bacterium]
MANNLSRKEFLLNASKAAIGVAGVASVASLVTSATVQANTKVTPWPWPYKTINPDDARIQAHNLYWNDKDCCAGVFGALQGLLAVSVGDPWTNMPMEVMLFGGGGGAGWGTLCGSLNGAAAFISLVVNKTDAKSLVSELWGWYTQAQLPTTTANDFATSGKYLMHKFDAALPQNISGSPLCHASVTEWCFVAKKKVSDTDRKERCARVAGDCAAKAAELLNQYFDKKFTPSYTDPATVAGCLACHGAAVNNNVMTKMNCDPCHPGDPHANSSSVQTLSKTAVSYELSQNYPNPFNPTTRIRFSLPETAKVNLQIFDIRGLLVKTLVEQQVYNAGAFEVDWNGCDEAGEKVSSGIYFAKMRSGNYMKTIKMNLLK